MGNSFVVQHGWGEIDLNEPSQRESSQRQVRGHGSARWHNCIYFNARTSARICQISLEHLSFGAATLLHDYYNHGNMVEGEVALAV